MTELFRPAFVHDYDIELSQHEDFVLAFRAIARTTVGQLVVTNTTGYFASFAIFAPDPLGTEVLSVDSVSGEVMLGYTPGPIQQSTAYALGQQGIPGSGLNGYLYECTTAGTTNTDPVIWPETIGQTVNYGTTIWTCVATDDLVANVFVHIDPSVTGTLTPWGVGHYTLSVSDTYGHSFLHVDGAAKFRLSSVAAAG